jgi:hypothetical protein
MAHDAIAPLQTMKKVEERRWGLQTPGFVVMIRQ